MKKVIDYKYLLRLYSMVDDYLASRSMSPDNFPEAVVSFCIVTERMLKIKLHDKNPVLVFDCTKFKDADSLVAIVKNIEKDIETIRIKEVVARYKQVFADWVSDSEEVAIVAIYGARNSLVHGYKPDKDILTNKEYLDTAMGTIWEKISKLATELFGEAAIKVSVPRKKYTEAELEGVLIEEVRKKIKNVGLTPNYFPISALSINTTEYNTFPFGTAMTVGEVCPRCGTCSFFSGQEVDSEVYRSPVVPPYLRSRAVDLYTCSSCHLELTRKEYDIAKKLKKE